MTSAESMGRHQRFAAAVRCLPVDRPRGVSKETFERCIKPFDLRILQAAQGMVRVLHAHGSGLLAGAAGRLPV